MIKGVIIPVCGALIGLAVLTAVTCSEDPGDVNSPVTSATLAPVLVITGETKDSEGNRLYETWVEWKCTYEGANIGGDYTDRSGAYHIWTVDDLAAHNGHTFEGVASKAGYYPDTQYIYNFNWLNIPYSVDFTLVPLR